MLYLSYSNHLKESGNASVHFMFTVCALFKIELQINFVLSKFNEINVRLHQRQICNILQVFFKESEKEREREEEC